MVQHCTNCLVSFLGVTIACQNYGEQIGNRILAKAVIFFYRNAWKASTTRTYKTGQRWWAKFTAAYPAVKTYPFTHLSVQEHELALAFFAAHLALQPIGFFFLLVLPFFTRFFIFYSFFQLLVKKNEYHKQVLFSRKRVI